MAISDGTKTPESKTPSPMADFRDILEIHRFLQDELLLHQESLVLGELEEASVHLDRFARAVRAHIRAEDEVLVPVYVGNGDQRAAGSAELITAEHRKIEKLLARAEAKMDSLLHFGEITAQQVISTIEEERILKELLSHHDQRERNTMVPELDGRLQGEERVRILRRMNEIHAAGGIA